jgi:hypothetical protein
MCRDCPTRRDRARGVARELTADLLLPFLLYGIVIGTVLVGTARVG